MREGQKYRKRRGWKEQETIAEAGVSRTKYTVGDLQSTSRKRDVSQLRREAMSLLYKEGYGPTEIGKFFNRTPASVVQAHREQSANE